MFAVESGHKEILDFFHFRQTLLYFEKHTKPDKFGYFQFARHIDGKNEKAYEIEDKFFTQVVFADFFQGLQFFSIDPSNRNKVVDNLEKIKEQTKRL